MIRSCTSLVFATVIQVVFGQGGQSYFALEPRRDLHDIGLYHPYQDRIPRGCWTPPHKKNILKCCPIPEFYTNVVMQRCGIKRKSAGYSKVSYKSRRLIKQHCMQSICLMTKSDLLMSNKSIDYEKLRTYIDYWVDMNPEFTEAILEAKKICAKGPTFEFIDPAACEQDRVLSCLTTIILWNCKLREYDDCQPLRDRINECKAYFTKPKDQEETIIENLK